jgi:iron complex outermembrane recepter protein
MKIKTLIISVISIVVTIPVQAQVALEEVVVTAQRREQNLQEVPVSVTAFSGGVLEQANITSARDYLALTPNVAFTDDGQSGSKGVGISIRGIGNLVSGENATVNSIGIYLDGFSVASVPNQVANPTIPDMQSIEVLRGPQGTFFGRNAVGGALNLTSNAPTDEFGYKISVGGESYDGANELGRVTGVINFPVSDTFRTRAVLQYEDSGGRVKNACRTGASAASCPHAAFNGFTPNGAKNSGYEEFYGRLKADWDVSENTTVGMTFIYSDADQGHDENVPSGILDTDSVDTLGIPVAQDAGPGFYPNNRNTLSHDLGEFNKNESLVAIINIQHQISDQMKLTSITGVIDAEQNRFFDQDLVGGADSIDRTNNYKGTSWSTELRLDYSGDSVDWTMGLMYSKDDQTQDNLVAVSTNSTATLSGLQGFLPPFPEDLGLAFNDKTFKTEEQAFFADLTFHMTDTLDLIAGGRFTHSQVDKWLQSQAIGPTCCFPGSPGFPGGPSFAFFQSFANSIRPESTGESDFTDFAPRFGARFQVTDEINIYTMVSKGYKPGGNSVGNNTNANNVAFQVAYDKETLWNYEIGFKSELFDNRLRLNASAFHLKWSNLQFESFFFLTPGDLSTNFEQFINIPDAKGDGAEMEFIALVSDNLTISGGFGYLKTKILSPQTVELSGGWQPQLQGLGLPKAPEFTANLVGEYRWPMGSNEAWVRLEYIHRDGQYSDIEGVTNQQLIGPTPNDATKSHFVGSDEFPYLSPDYDVLNLRAGYEMGNWSITGFVQNLTDEKYYTGTQENFGASGIRLRPNPLTIGGNISYTFGGI